MRKTIFTLITVLLAAGFARPALAAVSASSAFPAAKASHPLTLDVAASDPAWAAGSLSADNGWENLTKRSAAGMRTGVSMLYDDKAIYVHFHAEQPGVPIVATQTTNDVGFGSDDFVGVGLDTSGNGTNVYYFEVTPAGVRYQQASENVRYRPFWQAAARVTGNTWDATLIIPLRILRIHAGAKQTWRVNFIRNVATLGEHYTWSYDGVMADGPIGNAWPNFPDVRFWAAWNGLNVDAAARASRPKPRLEVYGLSSSGFNRNMFAQSDGEFLPEHVRSSGVDFTYPITNTINAVGTLNPDFSNVEIDQQTIAPQEFRRGLQEYRPFFAQGAVFLNPNAVPAGSMAGPQNLVFYSPGVGPFDRGAKVEGTFGRQAFGVLSFRGYDQISGNTFDDIAYGYRHSLQDRTFMYWADGVLAHHSLYGSDATHEFGVAGRNLKNGLVWGVNHAIEHGSWVPNGSAYSSNGFVDVHKPNYEVLFGGMDISPTYNPIDGFTATSDARGLQAMFDGTGASPGFKTFGYFATVDRFFDRSGAVHQADFLAQVNATLQNGFSIDGLGPAVGELRSYSLVDPASLGTNCDDANLPRTYFTGAPSYFCGRSDRFNLMQIPVGYREGTPTPVTASASFGNFGQDYVHLYTSSTSRPIGRYLSLGLEYDGTYERSLSSGVLDSQWLRRISLGAQLGPDTNVTVALRAINGRGGFALPGTNFAAAYHRRYRDGNELFVNFGTPAAPTTLNRFIVKYLFRFGSDAGT